MRVGLRVTPRTLVLLLALMLGGAEFAGWTVHPLPSPSSAASDYDLKPGGPALRNGGEQLLELEATLARALDRGNLSKASLLSFRRRFVELGQRDDIEIRSEYFDNWANVLALAADVPVRGAPEVQGGTRYLYEDVGLRELLRLQRLERGGARPVEMDTAAAHVLCGLCSADRGEELVERMKQVVPFERLQGLDVADVGGGCGAFLARLGEHVGDDEGTITLVEVDFRFQRLIDRISEYDERYSRIRFLLGKSESVGLPPQSCDLVFLLDVHMAGHTSESLRGANPWLRSILTALRPDGRLVVYEGRDGIPPLRYTREALEESGFQILETRTTVPLGQRSPEDLGYLLVCRPSSGAIAVP